MENVLNVVNQLKDDELESNKQYLIRLMSLKKVRKQNGKNNRKYTA